MSISISNIIIVIWYGNIKYRYVYNMIMFRIVLQSHVNRTGLFIMLRSLTRHGLNASSQINPRSIILQMLNYVSTASTCSATIRI